MIQTDAEFSSKVLLAWDRKLAFSELLSTATQLEAEGKAPLSAVLYRTWLERNETSHDQYIYFNLGVVLFNLNDLKGAKEAYTKAIELEEKFVQPHFNLGLVHERLNQKEAAINEFQWIVKNVSEYNKEFRPILLSALNNLGRILEDMRLLDAALQKLDRSLEIEPNQADVLHHWVFLREKQCLWPVYIPIQGVSPKQLQESTSALAMLSLTDDPGTQLEAARNYVRSKMRPSTESLAPIEGYNHKKIRIGYCSSDLCLHPVAMLTAELFELHDRENFEVYGFCWTKEDGSALRQRIVQAMDHFERIGELNDEAAARLIREKEIDILVDLHGQTQGARPNIYSYRPAPIQITYLGLPATTGLPSIDYVIADRFLIPEDMAKFYSETPIYMPDVYQASDRKRINSPAPSRESCGLPPDSFVFCSFNNNYKFTPEMFDTWMRILNRVPNSVLWLLSANPWAEKNLKTRANTLGIHEDRLIFAPRVAPEDYLARYLIADLFLDTFPFNAGTTANDVLWMGLPILTLSGKTFASRMAGALLTAAGVEELITYDFESYENKAVQLALSKDFYENTRKKIKEAKNSSPLFDMPRFVKNLEKIFHELKIKKCRTE